MMYFFAVLSVGFIIGFVAHKLLLNSREISQQYDYETGYWDGFSAGKKAVKEQ